MGLAKKLLGREPGHFASAARTDSMDLAKRRIAKHKSDHEHHEEHEECDGGNLGPTSSYGVKVEDGSDTESVGSITEVKPPRQDSIILAKVRITKQHDQSRFGSPGPSTPVANTQPTSDSSHHVRFRRASASEAVPRSLSHNARDNSDGSSSAFGKLLKRFTSLNDSSRRAQEKEQSSQSSPTTPSHQSLPHSPTFTLFKHSSKPASARHHRLSDSQGESDGKSRKRSSCPGEMEVEPKGWLNKIGDRLRSARKSIDFVSIRKAAESAQSVNHGDRSSHGDSLSPDGVARHKSADQLSYWAKSDSDVASIPKIPELEEEQAVQHNAH